MTKKSVLSLGLLALCLTSSAEAQPYHHRPGHHSRSWPAYREAVLLHVVDRVKELASPDSDAAQRRDLRQQTRLLLERAEYLWSVDRRRAYRELSRPAPLQGLVLSQATPPRSSRDRYAFDDAVLAEEDAALAELDEPWLRARKPQLLRDLRQQQRQQRDLYDMSWNLTPTRGWAALDLERVVAGLERLRRQREHERTLPLSGPVVVSGVPAGDLLTLRLTPSRHAPQVGQAPNGAEFEAVANRGRWVLLQDRWGMPRGWAHRSYLRAAQPVVTAPTPTRPTPTTPTIPPARPGLTIHLSFGR